MDERRTPMHLTRRAVLAALNLAVAGLAIGCAGTGDAPPGDTDGVDGADGLTANVFVHVDPSGEVTLVCQRSEMGQGIRSSLPVLIADEMGADMARVRIVQADGDAAYGDQNTDGSASIRTIYDEMRGVGATARTMLIAAAAARWGVAPDACAAREHAVWHAASGRTLGFGELAAEAGRLPVPPADQVQLRPASELRHVGGPLPLLDGPAYVTGAAIYGADVRLPGMLTAVIARPPVTGGRVVAYDEAPAVAVAGVRRVVTLPAPSPPWGFQPLGGVAVVADSTWAAMRGRDALPIDWDPGANAIYDSATYRETLAAAVRAPGTPLRTVGDAEAALAGAVEVIDAEYHVPHLPHVPMEPPAAVARVDGDTCEIWAPTQNPQSVQEEVARALGTTPDKVRVHVTFLGGAFGRKSKADFCVEAALLAREMGAPVRVQWTREDDVRHDYLNAVCTNRLTAGLDAAGKVVAWRHRTAFPPIATLFGGASTPSAGDLQQGVLDLALDVPNVSAEACAAPAYTRIGWLRSVYNLFQAFSIGSFVDELAHARGADPRAMWLELLGPPRQASLAELGIPALDNYGQSLEQYPVDVGRLRGVIERVTAVARWDQREGRALGLAAHRSFSSYAAVVASVVQTPDGGIAIDEVWLAFDGGTLVNPDRVAAQMEGSVIFGASFALFGEITLTGGAVDQSNYAGGGRIVRLREAPRTHVELIRNDAAPGGVGEPGVPPVAPAIANAVFALTGTRARELPLSRTFAV